MFRMLSWIQHKLQMVESSQMAMSYVVLVGITFSHVALTSDSERYNLTYLHFLVQQKVMSMP